MAVYLDKKTNKWYSSISYYEDSKIKHTTKRGFTYKRDAQRYETEFRDKLNSYNPQHKIITFKDALKGYLFDKKSSRKASTFDEIERISNTYFVSLFDKDIAEIKTVDYQEIKNSLVEKDISISYKNKILSLMKSISRYISGHYEKLDYAKIITRFVDHSIPKERPTWTPKEFGQFLENVDRKVYRDLFYVLYYTGARLGEIRALQKTDLKVDAIYINKSIRRAIEGVTSPKNKYSIRKVKLDRVTLAILQDYASTKGDFMFGEDKPLSQTNVDRLFLKYLNITCEKNNNFKRLRVHDLRHCHATLLINEGANIVAVSKRLGHSSVQQTLKTYTHLFFENELKLIEILDNLTI